MMTQTGCIDLTMRISSSVISSPSDAVPGGIWMDLGIGPTPGCDRWCARWLVLGAGRLGTLEEIVRCFVFCGRQEDRPAALLCNGKLDGLDHAARRIVVRTLSSSVDVQSRQDQMRPAVPPAKDRCGAANAVVELNSSSLETSSTRTGTGRTRTLRKDKSAH